MDDEEENLERLSRASEEVMRAKQNNPGMFVSAWEKDENDIDLWSSKQIAKDPLKQFIVAGENGDVSALSALIEAAEFPAKEYLTATDADGYTALHRAAYGGHSKAVEFLLSAGSPLDSETNDGWTPLHSAIFWNQTACVQLLVECGADYKKTTHSGQTAFHLAATNNQTMETIAFLLTLAGASDLMHQENATGDTASDLIRRHTPFSYVVDAFDEVARKTTLD